LAFLIRLAALAALLFTAIPSASAQFVSPPPGSPLRAQVLDAFRPAVEGQIGAPVIFVIKVLHVGGNWAYVEAVPQRPGGRRIDWARTRFREDFQAGMLEDLVLGLLQRSGRGWRVVEYRIGPTDIAWDEWVGKYRLPRRFFQP
jgi:hypothetical protein